MLELHKYGRYEKVIAEVLRAAPFESMYLHTGVRTPITVSGKRVFSCSRCSWWGLVTQVRQTVDGCPTCNCTLTQADLSVFLSINTDRVEALLQYMEGSDYWQSEEWRTHKKELLSSELLPEANKRQRRNK